MKRTFEAKRDILGFALPKVAMPAVIGGEGIAAVDGRKIIKAGTPVGGDVSTLENSQTVLKAITDAAEADKVQGVLQHDVDVTEGKTGGAVILWGWVNLARMDPSVTIADEIKAALAGKVTFFRRND